MKDISIIKNQMNSHTVYIKDFNKKKKLYMEEREIDDKCEKERERKRT